MISEEEWKKQFVEKFNACVDCVKDQMSIPQIAKHVGVNRASIYRWLNGESIPSAYHIFKLSQLFRVSPEYFVDFCLKKGV